MEKKMASWVTGDERSAIVKPILASRWCGVWSTSRCGGNGVLYKRCAIRHRLLSDDLLLAPHSKRWVGRGRHGDTNTVAQSDVRERLAQDEEDLGYIKQSRNSCVSWVKTVVV